MGPGSIIRTKYTSKFLFNLSDYTYFCKHMSDSFDIWISDISVGYL